MSFQKSLSTVSALAIAAILSAPGAALAVNVQVTFENLNTSQSAMYSPVSNGEVFTYANANPKPEDIVLSGQSDSYTVGNPITNLATSAHVRYKIGSKQCIFHTTYTSMPSGGALIPNWTKSYEASGGASCTATITYVDASNYNWKVKFTMK
ncbi:MAG: hypothetical protein LBL48_12060 [Azoarcus sp.]|jgi:hypothetical protein|nr:hypothetical protein [Azoarcus sp.]